MENIQKALTKYWGYNDFLPLQKQAMECIRRGQDSIVVLPTGGGKSLCFQAPAVTMQGLAIVVSPLISLMKDQVDALTECGITAERIDSSLSLDKQKSVLAKIYNKTLKILYLAPERLVSDGFIKIIKKVELSFIAIDEAHCVSMWGHDFRPEYRQLGLLRDIFPDVTIGAYTATATEHVRRDIAEQLRLRNPRMLIGSFDRPNLIYKVKPRKNIVKQVCSVLDRHKNESGIVYCIRRDDVDDMCIQLRSRGYNAMPYHAGMDNNDRKKNQELFITEKIDTIVATIAFGMGIDKSNVRYVIHSAMPKSIEHYQQESGRAGRDGLEAECCLFYSGGDYGTWKSLMRSMTAESKKIAMIKLRAMYNYCNAGVCRHKAILRYFGQDLKKSNCAACDICLGELKCLDDSLITAQKILSCILRLDQRFGSGYTASVLTGSEDGRIISNGHNKLSTYGLLSDYSKENVRDWIEQLVGQDYIEKSGQYNVLNVTNKGWAVLKGNEIPRLLKPSRKPAKVSMAAVESWEGVDHNLFEVLRRLRAKIASEKGLPAYIIFGDAALRDIARRRPSTLDGFLKVKGVGQTKCRQYGEDFLAAIKKYCTRNSIQTDVGISSETFPAERKRSSNPGSAKRLAFDMFKQKHSVEKVAKAVNRAQSTTTQYLVEYIKQEKISNPHPWVDGQTFHCIADTVKQTGDGPLKVIHESLNGRIDYDKIRISLACLRNDS
jgi:ATP-dependent DNA helicase RecQ